MILDEVYSIKKSKDKVILSAGHSGLSLYVVLEKYEGRNAEELFDKHGVHPNRDTENGIWVSSGSLGHGLSISLGMAIARPDIDIYCLTTDGEWAEGSCAEAHRIWKRNNVSNLKIYLNFDEYSAYDKTYLGEMPQVTKTYITNFDLLMPILKEPQEAHYVILDKKKYDIVMKQLE